MKKTARKHSPLKTNDTSNTPYKTSHTAVRKARRFALQGIYEWLCTDRYFTTQGKHNWVGANSPDAISARTRADNAMHTVHLGYYHTLMRDIPAQINDLNLLLQPVLDRDITRLDNIEYAVLLIGTYELTHSLHIPYKVVIDEAVELNNYFGASEGFRLVNAVLDKLAKKLRADEIAGTPLASHHLPLLD